MLKKGLVFVTIVLFVCISVVPSSGITTKNSVSLDPLIPSDPFPYDGETDVPIDGVILYWDEGNPWRDVYFGKSNPPPLVAEDIVDRHYDPGLMDVNTTYYWKVVGINGGGATYPGPIWDFTTGSRINHPPKPEITIERLGGGTGEGFYWIFIKLTDPDGDNIEGALIDFDSYHMWFPIYDPYQGDPPWANGTVLQEREPYYYGRGWHEITVTCCDSWVRDSRGYLEFYIPRNRAQSGSLSSSSQSSSGSSSSQSTTTQQSTDTLFLQNLQQLMNVR